MKRKICNFPGCNTLIDPSERYCSLHKRDKIKQNPFFNATRSNEELYKTPEWRALKRQILKEMPYCCHCGISENESVLEVHHIIPPRGDRDLFFDYHNVVSICPLCHHRITSMEIADRRGKN